MTAAGVVDIGGRGFQLLFVPPLLYSLLFPLLNVWTFSHRGMLSSVYIYLCARTNCRENPEEHHLTHYRNA